MVSAKNGKKTKLIKLLNEMLTSMYGKTLISPNLNINLLKLGNSKVIFL